MNLSDYPPGIDKTVEFIDQAIKILNLFNSKPRDLSREVEAIQIKLYLEGYKDCYLKDGRILLGMLNQVDKRFKEV